MKAQLVLERRKLSTIGWIMKLNVVVEVDICVIIV